MTKREFMNAVITLAQMNADADVKANGFTMTEMAEHAKAEIQVLDGRNAKRSSQPTKTQIENESIKSQILEVLTSEPKVASAIGEMVGISTQKASALCRQLVESGKVQVQEVKIPKKGKQKAYSVQVSDVEESEVIE